MADAGAIRVLLLAREGEARRRLEAALADAGAELLQALDPAQADPAAAMALRPGAVLVALEPAIEDALERFDPLLSDPSVLVLFEDSDVAAARDGWDAARWVRHLAAKLHGHQDVLPPGAGEDLSVHPAPGALPEREFDPSSVDIAALTGAAQDLAADVPAAEPFDRLGGGDGAFDPEAAPDAGPAAPGADAAVPADAEGAAGAAGAAIVDEGPAFAGLVPAEDMDWSSSGSFESTLADDPAVAALLASGAGALPGDVDAAEGGNAQPPLPAGDFSLAEDDGPHQAAPSGAGVDANALAAGLSFGDDDAPLEVRDTAGAVDADALGRGLSLADDDAPLESRAAAATVDPGTLGAGLSLADDDAPAVPAAATPRTSTPAFDVDALSARLDGLSLADPDSYGHGVLRGAVLVEAGLGGPDAVRQLLGALGDGFARPVLVRLQLDGGRYDRLVQQMQRASALPVALAEPGVAAEAGTVYFVPPQLALVVDRAQLVFSADEGDGAGYAALPAADSAVVFLSGAQAARTAPAMALAGEGALVIAQAPESCYDREAVDQLVAQGVAAAEPGDLARVLIDRWP